MNNDSRPDFLQCCLLDGRGGTRSLDHEELAQWTPDQGTLWVHLDYMDHESRLWLRRQSNLPRTALETLLAEETRPRCLTDADWLLVVLRGVNTNPGEDPEDMVAVRIWVDRHRIISARRRRLLSVQDIRAALDAGKGPTDPATFLAGLTSRLADRIGDFVDNIEERLEEAEEQVADQDSGLSRLAVAQLRRQVASVRRFLAPQREALDRLVRQAGTWIRDEDLQNLHDESDRITRYVEDLDLVRERTMVLQEEFLSQMALEQNSRMYVLSVVAAIFLPLTFITGLLGMNVGGLPGLESPFGFEVSVVVMLVSAAGLIGFFRWKGWL